MKIFKAAATAFFTLFSIAINAQTNDIEGYDSPRKNILKANLSGLMLRNYSFQYERVLTRSMSFAISYRFMPSGPAPFKNAIIDLSPDIDPENIDQMKLSNTAITPELRFYFGERRFGRGFYLAPFYRFTTHEANQVPVIYQPSDKGSGNVNFQGRGKLTSNSGGLLVGAQWNLGSTLVLDWWILGPHYGKWNGDFTAISARPLTDVEQAEIQESFDSGNPQFGIKSIATVNENGFDSKLNGPFGGIRAGLQLGIRF